MDGGFELNTELLLAPLSEDSPVGADPRLDYSVSSLYLKMKDARSEARRLERALDTDGDAPSANPSWQIVFDSGCEILSNLGKDIEVSAWIVEALARLHGFSGLLAGLNLSLGLIDRFWDQVYPLPDDEGMEPRLAPFMGLNGQSEDSPLIQCIRKMSVTGSSTPYGFWQYQKALEISQISDQSQRAEKIALGNVTLEEFNIAVAQTAPSFYLELVKLITDNKSLLDKLYNALFERVGVDAPPVSGINNALQQILDGVETFAKQKLDVARVSHEENSDQGGAALDLSGQTETVEATQKSGILTREAALRQIQKISHFFRENEPHSPISYTLDELVRRAHMSLPELLQEIIVDEEARKYFLISSGMGVAKHEAETGGDQE